MNFEGSARFGVLGAYFPRLRDYVDHQVPGPRLTDLCQRARDRLLLFVVGGSGNLMQRGSRHSGQPGNIASEQTRVVRGRGQ